MKKKKVQKSAGKPAPKNNSVMSFESLRDVERAYILLTLKENDYNKRATEQALGIAKSTLYLKLNQYRKEGFYTGPSAR